MTDETADAHVECPLPAGDYAIVEMMGHSTLVGRYTEVECFGTKMLALEPIFREAILPAIRVGGTSIYRMTPCTREVAWARRPHQEYQIPATLRATLPPNMLAPPADTEADGEGRPRDRRFRRRRVRDEPVIAPVRLQLSRRKGFNLQELSRATNGLEAAKVARPSMFGNPFTIATAVDFHAEFGQPENGETPRATAVRWFLEWLDGDFGLHPEAALPPSHEEIVHFLGGKNLACWCRADQPCHADVLLEVSNR